MRARGDVRDRDAVDRRELGALGFLVLIVALAYLPALRAGFVWDDIPLVLQNRVTQSPDVLWRAFGLSLWETTTVDLGASTVHYYRPLMVLSLALDRLLFGLEPAGYHLHSLGWHLLAVVLVWRLARELLPAGGGALLAATAFGLHPVQSEAVVWVAARNDAMALALGVGALLLLLRPRLGWRELLGAGVLALAAGLAKESVVLLPALYWVLARCLGRLEPRALVPLLAGIGGVWLLRALAGVPGSGLVQGELLAFALPRLPAAAGTLAASLVLPWPLSGARSLEWLHLEPAWRVGVGWLVLLGLTSAAWLRRGPGESAARAGWLWALLCGAPVVLPVANTGLMGERYLYLPMVGLALLLGALLGGRARAAALLFAVPWVVVLQARLPDWQSDRTLWAAALRDVPTPHNEGSLALVLRTEGEDAAALELFTSALGGAPPHHGSCVGVVGAALALGRPVLASQLGGWAAGRGCPAEADAGTFAGVRALAHARAGDWVGAAERLQGAPPDPSGRGTVVAAALALREGDAAGYDAIEAGWSGARPLDEQARGLLEAAGEAVPR